MVATLNQARERIYQTFNTDWGSTSAFTFDNDEFDPPAAADWVRFSVRHFDSNQESLGGVGNRKFLREGRIFVQCFTPLDSGLAGADNLATVARNIFEGKTLGTENIRCTDAVVREIGPTDDGFYQLNVEIAFNYSEVK
jgi:hypothetical protein